MNFKTILYYGLIKLISAMGWIVFMKIAASHLSPESYGNFNKNSIPHATNIKLENQTLTKVLLLPGTENADVKSKGGIINSLNNNNSFRNAFFISVGYRNQSIKWLEEQKNKDV